MRTNDEIKKWTITSMSSFFYNIFMHCPLRYQLKLPFQRGCHAPFGTGKLVWDPKFYPENFCNNFLVFGFSKQFDCVS